MADNRTIAFTPAEMVRLLGACRGLGTSYADFVHFAVIRALDEVEGLARQEREQREAWQRLQARPTVNVIRASQIQACPLRVLKLAHYRADGTCECSDTREPEESRR